MEIDPDLHPDLRPLAWLVGTWRGAGVGGYPTIDSFRFGQEIVCTPRPGGPQLAWSSRSWLLDDDGRMVKESAPETGWWRVHAGGALEVLLAHPMGIVEVWTGRVEGAKAELTTDVVARTETAKEVTAGHRLYGVVDGDLLWAYDMAAVGQGLTSHLSARLKRA